MAAPAAFCLLALIERYPAARAGSKPKPLSTNAAFVWIGRIVPQNGIDAISAPIHARSAILVLGRTS
jgi:hypothetical protein